MKRLAVFLAVVSMVACSSKDGGGPTDPPPDQSWPVAFHVTEASDQARALRGVRVTILSANADILTVETDQNGNTPAVTIYQAAEPHTITVSTDSSQVISSNNYLKFTGSVTLTQAWYPREQKTVYVGSIGLEKQK